MGTIKETGTHKGAIKHFGCLCLCGLNETSMLFWSDVRMDKTASYQVSHGQ